MEWYFIVLLSACFLAGADLFMKKSLFTDHVLFLLPFVFRMHFSFSFSLYSLIFLKACLVSGAWLLFMKGVRHLELSKAIPLKNLSSFFVVILSFFFLGERLTFLQWGGILILIFGAALLELEKDIFHFIHKIKELPKHYLFLILLGLFLGALCAILDKIILREVEVLTFTFLNFAFLFILYFIYSSLLYHGYKDMITVYKKTKWLVLGFSSFMLIADYLHFYVISIPSAYISLIIPIRRLGSLISTLVGGEMFHEHQIGIRVFASTIMLIGVLLLVL